MLIIVNPYATTVSDRLRHLVVYALQGRFEVDAVDTEAQGHATELCREAAHEGYDVVVAFGGDGTVNEAANGLIGSPSQWAGANPTPLTCLPGGSANVFGKMLGIPGELVDATEHLLAMADDWRPRTVDLGVVNGRCFTFASGLGVDASVVERVDSNPRLKARLGAYYFTWAAISTFARRYLVHPPRMVAHAGEQTLEGVTTIVQNGSPFTYFHEPPDRGRRGRGARLGCARGRGPAPRAAAGHALDRLARLLSRRAHRPSSPGLELPRAERADGAERRRAPAAAAGRRRLHRRGRRGALLDPPARAQRRQLSASAALDPSFPVVCYPAIRRRRA